MDYIIVSLLVALFLLFLLARMKTSDQALKIKQLSSDYKYSVFTSPINNPRSLTLVSEGNQIDDLGYLIYRDYADKLDEIDILIRDNQNGELMKIVKDSDSESMISVNDPIKGHIGYLQIESFNS